MWSTSTILEVLFWTGLLVAYLTYAPSHKDTSWSRPQEVTGQTWHLGWPALQVGRVDLRFGGVWTTFWYLRIVNVRFSVITSKTDMEPWPLAQVSDPGIEITKEH